MHIGLSRTKNTSECEHFEDIEWIFQLLITKLERCGVFINDQLSWTKHAVSAPERAIWGTPRVEVCFSLTTMSSFLQTAIYSSGSVPWSPLLTYNWPSLASHLPATRPLCSTSRCQISLCTRPSVLLSSLCWDRDSTWLTLVSSLSSILKSNCFNLHPHTDTTMFQEDDQRRGTQIFYSFIKKPIPKSIQVVNFACDLWYTDIPRSLSGEKTWEL